MATFSAEADELELLRPEKRPAKLQAEDPSLDGFPISVWRPGDGLAPDDADLEFWVGGGGVLTPTTYANAFLDESMMSLTLFFPHSYAESQVTSDRDGGGSIAEAELGCTDSM